MGYDDGFVIYCGFCMGTASRGEQYLIESVRVEDRNVFAPRGTLDVGAFWLACYMARVIRPIPKW